MKRLFILSGILAVIGFSLIAKAQVGQIPDWPPAKHVSTGSTNFAQDSFTGTPGTALSSHTDDLGNTWTNLGGTGGAADCLVNIQSQSPNAVGCTSSGSANNLSIDNGAPSSADYTVQAVVTDPSLGGGYFACVVARDDGTINNFYNGCINRFSGNWEIAQTVSGTRTVIGTPVALPGTLSTHTIALTVAGTTLSLAVDGSTIITATGSGPSGAGKSGLWQGGNGATTSCGGTANAVCFQSQFQAHP